MSIFIYVAIGILSCVPIMSVLAILTKDINNHFLYVSINAILVFASIVAWPLFLLVFGIGYIFTLLRALLSK